MEPSIETIDLVTPPRPSVIVFGGREWPTLEEAARSAPTSPRKKGKESWNVKRKRESPSKSPPKTPSKSPQPKRADAKPTPKATAEEAPATGTRRVEQVRRNLMYDLLAGPSREPKADDDESESSDGWSSDSDSTAGPTVWPVPPPPLYLGNGFVDLEGRVKWWREMREKIAERKAAEAAERKAAEGAESEAETQE